MPTELPARVRITDVGPRDGLQNEGPFIPTDVKAAFVRALVRAGLRDVEVTSFVRPDRIPQLADADALFQLLGPPPPGVLYSAFVPNRRGLERALAVGVRKVAVFTATTETFADRNLNTSVDGSFRHFAPVALEVLSGGLALRGCISNVTMCPYEGAVAPAVTRAVALRLLELGCEEIVLCDTVGAARPAEIARLLDVLLTVVPPEAVVLHLHDTRGMAVANVIEGLRHGVSAFDSSAGGLGGCPYAPGSAGNLATEDLVFLLDGWGVEHGVGLEALRLAAAVIEPHLDHPLVSRVHSAPPLPMPPQETDG